MNSSGFMGLFIRVSEWVFRFTAVNLLWIIFNLPIIFLMLNILLVTNFHHLIILYLSVIVIAPFIFFPATTAMFALIRKWTLGEDISIIKTFIMYYKANYLNSMLGGGIISIVLVVLFIDYCYLENYLSPNRPVFILFLFIFMFMFIVVFTLHFFSITVHLEIKLFSILKNSLLITLGKPILTLTLGVVSSSIIYISIKVFTFAILFFMGSLIAYIAFVCCSNIYEKFSSVQENV
ncbi:YesL family protein [Gracilibacillus sp. D59]|uniref:YesL family protein n=1 Tax=Gracilibacillus sp. D59 TaxID=3457434 RepID=UPI003FCE923A